MKRTLAILLAIMMLFSFVACANKTNNGGEGGETEPTEPAAAEKTVINLYAFTDEVPNMATKWVADKGLEDTVEFNSTIVGTADGQYEQALDLALQDESVDVYALEAAFVLKYTQGDACDYAATYKDIGIDVEKGIKDAEIAPYVAEIGTRPDDGEVVALAYQSTGGCFIFNDEVAKEVWPEYEGFEADPDFVANKIGAGSGNWDAFKAAADECKAANVAIVSGDGDVWNVVQNSSDKGWIDGDNLYIDPKREAFIDFAKELYDNDWTNKTSAWSEAWFADMCREGERDVLGFYGPAWLVNYTIAPHAKGDTNDTSGQWRVCQSNVGFLWGGTWIACGQAAADADETKKEIIADFITWVTLDTSEDGLLYAWANGLMNENGTKDTVSSNVVLAKSNGESEFLGGQDMFVPFMKGNEDANGRVLTQYDQTINDAFTAAVGAYCSTENTDVTTKEECLELFKTTVNDKLGFTVAE